ncbi:hypothetical protein AWB64_01264 [Caballeronia sordidicola]|uniref:Uncharacterized protein n=1 Tax=Caballeronia sordidicola TaxID=196367 RepID=A0A158FFR0_CABSO|nr:hypothetical protein [Caballeronia sordidicola]SAL18575.1 hypothetical protein AWB64_01264 [Caballeronia sordidicola]
MVAIVFAFAGLFFGIKSLLSGEYFSAGSSIICGGMVATAVTLRNFDVLSSNWWEVGACLCTAVSLFGAFAESPALDMERQEIQNEIWQQSAELAFGVYGTRVLATEVTAEAENLLKSCAMQATLDLQATTVNAQKALYLGPTASLLEASAELTSKPPPQDCLAAFANFNRAHPELFIRVTRKHAEWLRRHKIIG